jgi:antitoxin component of RelBE/YafQ-DinJ toxin-antitoxin module
LLNPEIIATRVDAEIANKIKAVTKQLNLSKTDLLRESIIDYLENNFIFS